VRKKPRLTSTLSTSASWVETGTVPSHLAGHSNTVSYSLGKARKRTPKPPRTFSWYEPKPTVRQPKESTRAAMTKTPRKNFMRKTTPIDLIIYLESFKLLDVYSNG